MAGYKRITQREFGPILIVFCQNYSKIAKRTLMLMWQISEGRTSLNKFSTILRHDTRGGLENVGQFSSCNPLHLEHR